MTVFIFFLVAVAAYYFMKRNLQNKYNVEFVRKTKWIIRAPILQVIFLGSSIFSSVLIFMEFMFLNIDLSDFGGIFASTSHISSKYLDSLSTIAFVVSILALLGLILFIVMIIKQIRGIFGISDGRRVKKAHGIALGTYAIVTFCSMIYFLNLAMCVSDSGNDFSLFYGYAGFAARVVFFVVVLILFGLIRKKYNTAVDLFFETREQETASNVAKTSQDASSNYDNSKTKQLLELKSLLDKGLLTQEEFNNEKRKILNS